MSSDTENRPPSSASALRKVGIGMVAVAVPVAAAVTVWQLKQSEDAQNEDLEKSFQYDVKALQQVDASLIGWKEVGTIQTHLAKATCIAKSTDGKLLIGGDKVVKILDSNGMELASFAIPAEATAIAAAPNGDIYVGMMATVEVYGFDGVKKAGWQTIGPGSHISSIVVGPKAVYIADSGHRAGRVLICSADGVVTGQLAKANPAAGIVGLITPSPHMDVALTPSGDIWIANPGHHQLELYSPAGELLRSFGQSGTDIAQFIGCCNPSDFALLTDGRIVTAEKGVARLKVFTDDGHFLNVVAPPSLFGDNRAGLDIATDAAGRIFVLEPGTTSVRIFAEAKP